jgi:hypothetical protein
MSNEMMDWLQGVKSTVKKMTYSCAGGTKGHFMLDASSVIHAMDTELIFITWRDDSINKHFSE